MPSVSVTSPNNTTIKIIMNIISILTSLGIGIYAAVILGTSNKDDVSSQIYAFVLTTCIVQFVSAVITIVETITNKNSTCSSLSGLISLGLFIWCCVILFDQIGVDNNSVNPYYTVVFVYFIIFVICLGLVICILPCVCCMTCYTTNNINEENAAKTQEANDKLKQTLDAIDKLMKMKEHDTQTTGATAPTISTSNVTV